MVPGGAHPALAFRACFLIDGGLAIRRPSPLLLFLGVGRSSTAISTDSSLWPQPSKGCVWLILRALPSRHRFARVGCCSAGPEEGAPGGPARPTTRVRRRSDRHRRRPAFTAGPGCPSTDRKSAELERRSWRRWGSNEGESRPEPDPELDKVGSRVEPAGSRRTAGPRGSRRAQTRARPP